MKVITIKEPFATLIAEGYKEYEFRTWNTNYRGEILIHAGKGVDKQAMERFKHLHLKYSSGKIIAKAILTDCIKIDEENRKMLQEKNDNQIYSGIISYTNWKGYGFHLESVQKITPITINGKLSLWDYDYKN